MIEHSPKILASEEKATTTTTTTMYHVANYQLQNAVRQTLDLAQLWVNVSFVSPRPAPHARSLSLRKLGHECLRVGHLPVWTLEFQRRRVTSQADIELIQRDDTLYAGGRRKDHHSLLANQVEGI